MGSVKNIGAQVKLRVERARSQYGWFDVAVQTFKRYSDDDGGFYAASLTYYTFFSIFPLLLFAVAALGYATFGNEELQDEILNTGVDSFPVLRQVLRNKVLAQIQERRGSIALSATLLALYTGTGAIVAFQHALNRTYKVETEGTFLQKRVTALKFLAGLGLLTLISVALGAIGPWIGGFVTGLLALIAGLATSMLLFAVAYRVLPQRRVTSWRDVLPGAVVAGVVFEILKRVGAFYVQSGNEGRNATFGTFATAATLLVSAYLLCQIALLAAEFNAVLAERRVSREFSLADKEVVP